MIARTLASFGKMFIWENTGDVGSASLKDKLAIKETYSSGRESVFVPTLVSGCSSTFNSGLRGPNALCWSPTIICWHVASIKTC